ncbi:three component ABC system middle component [Azospirillum halopraeferens]|uniref:three component ABC system middle component n=1 Tax=Azospirillum halopraeferens TaxID=34010 RepID=UPI00049221F9|nr:three component ABC system middle component [Azospirillum halopraeferens]
MNVAYDIYSETNPAFCAYALVAFTTAYLSVNPRGPELPTVYLALPVALSGDLGGTFHSTNKNTGLLKWLERSPQIQIGLSERVNASLDFVTEAMRFGCFAQVLALDEGARLRPGGQKLKKGAVNRLSEEPAQVIKRAERLGNWFAAAGSTKTVFDMMGLTV